MPRWGIESVGNGFKPGAVRAVEWVSAPLGGPADDFNHRPKADHGLMQSYPAWQLS